MCGRFTASMGEHMSPEEVAVLLGLDVAPPPLPGRWNVAPGTPVAAALNQRPRVLEDVQWGLVFAQGGRPLINARVETVATRPGFRGALAERRGVVLADGFYEWRHRGGSPGSAGRAGRKPPLDAKRTPFLIQLPDGRPFMMAAIWNHVRMPDGSRGKALAILTQPAGGVVAGLHDRMPVILAPEARELWLDPAPLPPEQAAALLGGVPAQLLRAHPVSPAVGSVANDSPELMREVPEPALEPAPAPAPPPQKQLGFGFAESPRKPSKPRRGRRR